MIFIFMLSCVFSYDLQALEECVDFNIETDRKIYHSGENLFLNVNIKIDEGFHIYSVHPEKSLGDLNKRVTLGFDILFHKSHAPDNDVFTNYLIDLPDYNLMSNS